MNVLCLSDLWLPFPGGAERYVYNVCRELQQRGHHVTALTGYEHPRTPAIEVSNALVPLSHDHRWFMIEHIIHETPTVVLTHHTMAFEYERELVESKVPLVQLVYNGHRIPSADIAVYISDFVRWSTDTHAYDMTIIPPAYPDCAANHHESAVGFIKPIEHKGVKVVYELARRMPERKFVVLRGEWQTLEIIEDLPNVEYVEPVRDMREFYERVDRMIVPSISEDAGTVAQEATLNGIPCISTAVGGLVETNAGGVLISHQPDVTAWVRAIHRLDDPHHYAAIVERQQDTYAEHDHASLFDELSKRVDAL